MGISMHEDTRSNLLVVSMSLCVYFHHMELYATHKCIEKPCLLIMIKWFLYWHICRICFFSYFTQLKNYFHLLHSPTSILFENILPFYQFRLARIQTDFRDISSKKKKLWYFHVLIKAGNEVNSFSLFDLLVLLLLHL